MALSANGVKGESTSCFLMAWVWGKEVLGIVHWEVLMELVYSEGPPQCFDADNSMPQSMMHPRSAAQMGPGLQVRRDGRIVKKRPSDVKPTCILPCPVTAEAGPCVLRRG